MQTFPPELSDILTHLKRVSSIERVLLFGSQARGKARATSDIDLALVAPALTTQEWVELLYWAEAEAPTLKKLDLCHFDTLDVALQDRILKEGQVVYER